MFSLFKKAKPDDSISDTKYGFKPALNHKKNLKTALKLVKKWNITKDIPFERELYIRYTDKDSFYGTLGHRCFIELNQANTLVIYERNVFENLVLVNIQLNKLKELQNEVEYFEKQTGKKEYYDYINIEPLKLKSKF